MPDHTLHLSSNGSVFYNSSEDIGGFQFTVEGATVLGVSGGDAAFAAYQISSSSATGTVLGFSMTGTSIAAGCGKLVELEATIKGFDAICKGEYDHLPEASFYMVGTIEEAVEKAEKMARDAAA